MAEIDNYYQEADWRLRAACGTKDPELFFTKGERSRQDRLKIEEAKKVCGGCDARNDRLEWAMNEDERFGVWGGLSEKERQKLNNRNKSKRARGAAALRYS